MSTMFSIFKAKSKDPLKYEKAVGFADEIAEQIAKLAISNVRSAEKMLADLNMPTSEIRSLGDAAFEKWVLYLYFVYMALKKNRDEYKDSSNDDFLNPVFDRIYSKSKSLFEVLHSALGDAILTRNNVDFDSNVNSKLDMFSKLPLTPPSEDKIVVSNKSVIGVAMQNEFRAFDIKAGLLMEQSLFSHNVKYAINYLEVFRGGFIAMRNNMK